MVVFDDARCDAFKMMRDLGCGAGEVGIGEFPLTPLRQHKSWQWSATTRGQSQPSGRVGVQHPEFNQSHLTNHNMSSGYGLTGGISRVSAALDQELDR